MVVSCPNCATSFRVDPAKLGTEGRMVRCSACRHTWFQPPPRPEPPDIPPVPPEFAAMDEEPAARRRQPGVRAGRRPARQSGGSGIAAIAILIVIALAVATGAAAYILRDRILAEFPELEPYYELAGIAPKPGEGLAVEDEVVRQGEVDGRPAFVATGQIVNRSQLVRPIPMLVAVLRDAAKRRIDARSFELETKELAPGESVSYETFIENPPPEATFIRIEFAERPKPSE